MEIKDELKKFFEEPENLKSLTDILAKNGGVLTATATEDILKKFGVELQERLTAEWTKKFGEVEKMFTQKDLDKKSGDFKNFADFVMAVKNYKEDKNINRLKTLTTDTQGDFIIPVEYQSGIMDFGGESNSFMQMATKFPLKGNSFSFPYYKSKNRTSANFYGGIVSYWVEEGTAPTESDMKFGKVNFRLHDLAMLIPATNDMIEDAPEAIAGIINNAFQYRLAYDLENVFLNGTGVGQPLGWLNSSAIVTQAKKTSQATATIVSENLIAMRNRLPKQCQKNAIWIYAPTVATEVLNCKVGASDFPAFIPAGTFRQDQTLDTLLGKPAFESEHLSAALGTEKDIILVDPTQYGVAYKNTFTPQVESSAHLYFDSNKTAFRLIFRVDGQPLWETFITPAQGSATKSPIVTLATRT
jgi:HK97 family phage major capsid protein